MAENEPQVKNPSGKWLKWLFGVVVIAFLVWIYKLNENRNKEATTFESSLRSLNERITSLEREKSDLQRVVQNKEAILTTYAPYLTLIRHLRLADTAYQSQIGRAHV